jgi:hypothetical protein
LTTAASALPDFSLSCHPAGTPAASTPEEKSAITIPSSAHTGAVKRKIDASTLLNAIADDIGASQTKNPSLVNQEGVYSFDKQIADFQNTE